MVKRVSEVEYLRDLHGIVGEIVLGENRGDIRAIGAVILERDGTIRTLTCYSDGTKSHVLAGTALLQHELVAAFKEFNKDRSDD